VIVSDNTPYFITLDLKNQPVGSDPSALWLTRMLSEVIRTVLLLTVDVIPNGTISKLDNTSSIVT